jgi:magnesium transporter
MPASPVYRRSMPTNGAEWIDLLDPDEETLRRTCARRIHPLAMSNLLAPAEHDDEPRPKLESHGDYVFGVLLVPVELADENRVYYQEVDLIIAEGLLLTVRKTPADGEPIDLSGIGESARGGLPAGMLAYLLFDQVAESFLDLVDDLHDEIDELEDKVEEWSNDRVRRRLSDIRHDLLHIRRTLAPTRDAARRVIDDRIEIDTGDLFPRDVELHFGDTYDKLLRATEGLESARDLIAGVRDYHQSKVANDQNEVMKRLTAVASILLVPTFIVGLYGQNFHNIPELAWAHGYGFSWALIIVTTLLQVWYFRRKGWIGS